MQRITGDTPISKIVRTEDDGPAHEGCSGIRAGAARMATALQGELAAAAHERCMTHRVLRVPPKRMLAADVIKLAMECGLGAVALFETCESLSNYL